MDVLQGMLPRAANMFMNVVAAPLLLLMLPPVATVTTALSALWGTAAWVWRTVFGSAALSLRDKVVVITGASSGIGEHMALEFARRGAMLVLAARREERLQEVAKECRKAGAPAALVKRTDVSQAPDCHALVQYAVDELGKIDVLVNNAGAAHSGLVESYKDPADFSSLISVDFWGNVWPTLYALPHLRKTQGLVFVTASAAAYLTYPRQAFYNASKAALVQFYDTLRTEIHGGVAVTIALPGFIKSEMTSSASASSHIPWFWPLMPTDTAACQLVDAIEQRQHYSILPLWYTTWLPYRLFAPEIMDWVQRMLLLGRAPSAAVHELLSAGVGEEATDRLFSHLSALPAALG